MAASSSPQHEPTMEEILASIRKIISEDSSESPPAPQPAAPAAAAPEPDVLDLTHVVEDIPAPAPALIPTPVAPVTLATAPEPVKPADDLEFQSIEEVTIAAAPASHAPSGDGFVSAKTRLAVDDALSGLDFGDEERTTSISSMPGLQGRSVEAVFDRAVRETFDPVLRAWLSEQTDEIVERMKPAIREWMEETLPSMLRSAVEEEVTRAIRTRSKR